MCGSEGSGAMVCIRFNGLVLASTRYCGKDLHYHNLTLGPALHRQVISSGHAAWVELHIEHALERHR